MPAFTKNFLLQKNFPFISLFNCLKFWMSFLREQKIDTEDFFSITVLSTEYKSLYVDQFSAKATILSERERKKE